MTQPAPAAVLLTAAQAAARLDVKIETLYVYVSRGLLPRHRTAAGSQFEPMEIERFALARRRNGRGQAARIRSAAGSPLMVIDTDVALIEDDQLYFRGRNAVDLASTMTFESAAAFVLSGQPEPELAMEGDERAVRAARAVLAAMPPVAGIRDLLEVSVTVLGACDALRATAEPGTVRRVAPALLGGMVDSLPSTGNRGSSGGSLAERLWRKLSRLPAGPAQVGLMNAALVLLIEHDLAISTMAARAAASARAAPYAVVATGLAALDSALHGRSSRACHRLLIDVLAGGHPERALAEAMRDSGHGLPGFGHPLYSGWDPRARYLVDRLAEGAGLGRVADAVHVLAETAESRSGLHPNVDLALAAISVAGDMPSSAAEGIFGIARSVGWLAHAADEYTREPMRMRPSGRYVGL